MAYNKQANPWGGSTSELGWRGFADGSKHGNPAALAPPSSDPYTKLAIKAITDIGGAAWDEYTAPVNAGQSMWGDELKGFDTAIAAQKTPEAIEGAQMAKRNFIRAHPNAGKEIYSRPEWTDNVPDFLMPGGSRYKTPEGMLNARQAREKRDNYKAPLGINYEVPQAKVVVPPPVKTDNATKLAELKTKKVLTPAEAIEYAKLQKSQPIDAAKAHQARVYAENKANIVDIVDPSTGKLLRLDKRTPRYYQITGEKPSAKLQKEWAARDNLSGFDLF
jgi:hypothetical protein